MRGGNENPELSPRERELLTFAAQGLTDAAIARQLGISEATVGTYWGRVRIKLGPYSRTELVALMLRAEHQASLEALRQENAALAARLKHTDPAEDFYRSLLEQAPDAILLVSSEGLIQSANSAASDLFGYPLGALDGRNVADLIPEPYRGRHASHRADYVRDPQRRQMGEHLQTPALRQDGSAFRIRAALSAVHTPAGLVVVCVVREAESQQE